MCLAIPGEVLELNNYHGFVQGIVSFGGIKKEISLACIPDIKIGEFVLVHAGLAISKIDPIEAQRIYNYLEEINAMDD